MQRLSRNRHQHQLARDLKKASLRQKQYGLSKINFGKHSKILGFLARNATRSLSQSRKREVEITIPETLSFIDDPEGALDIISAFACAAYKKTPRKLIFDHSRLKTYDLAANALLDLVATEIDSYYKIRNSRYKMKSRGRLPICAEAQRFIRSIGIIKHLEVKHEAPIYEEAKNIFAFDHRRKNYVSNPNPSTATFVDRTATKFVDHINRCLETLDRQLTREGVGRLTEYVTEILNNAEEHAGLLDWTLQSYLDTSANTPYCEIGIFNFGQSIAETLEDWSSYTEDQVGAYVSTHSKRKLFNPSWRREDLLTVIALQPHVSSKNYTKEDSRGQGTVDLIQFFQKIQEEISSRNTSSRMAILSGGTHILFDGKYYLSESENGLECIAFNEKNDLNERPDSRYVKSLGSYRFPGTLISIKFPLHKGILTEGIDHGEKSDNN